MKPTWKRIFSFIMALCMLVSLAPFPAAAASNTVTVEGTRYYSMAYEVLNLVNQERTGRGLAPLTMSAAWMNTAMLRSEELSVFYSHTRPDGSGCQTAFPSIYGWGENIAAGYSSPAAVMNGWMNSEGHRKNILNGNYKTIGIGVFKHNGTLYWAQCFSTSSAGHTPAPSDYSCAPTINLGSQSYPFTISGKSTMTVGAEYQFRVRQSNPGYSYFNTYLKNDSVGWQSSNPAVATVSAGGMVTAVSPGTATISAYGGSNILTYTVTVNAPVHYHTMTHVKAVQPTYSFAGNIEYWHCSGCGKNFSDADGKTEVTDVTLDKLVCTKHLWDSGTLIKPSTTEEQGEISYTCTNCYTTKIEYLDKLPAHAHSMTYFPAVAPTYFSEGSIEHWYCSGCNKRFTDADGKNEVTDVTLDKLVCTEHSPQVIDGLAPTCTEDGLTEGCHCDRCGMVLIAQEIIPAYGHTDKDMDYYCDTCHQCLCTHHSFIYIDAVPATCTEEGRSESAYCQLCGYFSHPETTTPALGHIDTDNDIVCDRCGESTCENHVPTQIKGYAATCTDNGLTDGTICSICDKIIEDQQLIPATGHIDEDRDYVCDTCGDTLCVEHKAIVIKGIAPTCTEDGLTNGKLCMECGKVLIEQTVLPAMGHTPRSRPGRDATCTESGIIGSQYCGICGAELVPEEVLPPLGHQFIDGVCVRCGKSEYPPIVNPFADVTETDFFYDPVLWAVEEKVTSGVSPTEFAPYNPCTRAQVVTFLWRAAGEPVPNSTNPFRDVEEGTYYYKAVLWAVEQGITAGVSPTEFAPDRDCTRGQIVTFLWRAAGKPQAEADNPFHDNIAAQFYYDAVLWAVEQGITKGVSDVRFGPDETCTRGQIVTFLYRYYN